MGGAAAGGGVEIAPRDPAEEKKTVKNWYDFQNQELGSYVSGSPILSAMNTAALDYNKQLPGLLGPLQGLFQNLPSITPTLNNLQSQFGGLPSQLMGLTGTLEDTANGRLSDIIGSGGALTPQMERDVSQATRTAANQYGTGRQLGTLGTELLNRDSAQQGRYNTALGQYGAATSQIGALDQLAQGLGVGLASAKQGLQGQDLAQRSGLAGSIQGLQTGGLNQLSGTQQTNVGTFSQLTNPILSYLGDLFGQNLQGRIAQANVNQQGNIATDNKTMAGINTGVSAVGNIVGGIAMSDERVKTKIKKTDLKTAEGIPLKTFEYKTKPGHRFLGPMAQDVEKRLPDRVLTDPVSGIKFVVDFPMIEISPMERAA